MARIPSTIAIMTVTAVVSVLNACLSAGFAAEQTVRLRVVDDQKAVIATVEPVHELLARARIGGTITTLTVKEGDRVTAGDRIALVADQKLALQMQALQERFQAQQANRDQAQINFDRVQKLRGSGVRRRPSLTRRGLVLMWLSEPCRRCFRTGKLSKSKHRKVPSLHPALGAYLRCR